MIPGSPEAIEAAATDLRGVGRDLEHHAQSLRSHSRSLDADWDGAASTAAVTTLARLGSKLLDGADASADLAPILMTYAAALRSAQRRFATGQHQAQAGQTALDGLQTGASAAADTARAHAHQDVSAGQGVVTAAVEMENQANVTAAVQVNALTARLVAMGTAHQGGGPGDPNGDPDGDARGPDDRRGRRLRSDEVFGRSEGGEGRDRRRGGDLDSDWAGRTILERYLEGGDDWTIQDDPQWTKYMQDNPLLRDQLLGRTQITAQDALRRFRRGEGAQQQYAVQEKAEMENGESITGYNYLHGTDSNAGGFKRSGTTEVRARPDGNYEVTVDGQNQWNDNIDPNGQYRTDQVKSTIAEIGTLGKADPYAIHIGWHSHTTVVLDPQGNVVSVQGYPGK